MVEKLLIWEIRPSLSQPKSRLQGENGICQNRDAFGRARKTGSVAMSGLSLGGDSFAYRARSRGESCRAISERRSCHLRDLRRVSYRQLYSPVKFRETSVPITTTFRQTNTLKGNQGNQTSFHRTSAIRSTQTIILLPLYLIEIE
jgi:hypothetical protein